MHIGVVTFMYPAWSETFVRREVEALRDLGHRVTVFTGRAVEGPKMPASVGVAVKRWELAEVKASECDVLYGSLSFPAHNQTVRLSDTLRLPFVIRVWSGLDIFTHPAPEFYSVAASRPACRGFVVEDLFMADWAQTQMAILATKLIIVPNSLDLSQFPLIPRKGPPERRVALAVSRFVPKKGLIHLVRAMRAVPPPARLWLVGAGPEEARLRAESGERVQYLGTKTEVELLQCYAHADVLVAPCVKAKNGDADGIPTVVLEAMAVGRPVIVSDLLSASCYVTDRVTGRLVPPGDEQQLAAAISEMLQQCDVAQEMGLRGREWALKHLDIKKNILTIEAALRGAV